MSATIFDTICEHAKSMISGVGVADDTDDYLDPTGEITRELVRSVYHDERARFLGERNEGVDPKAVDVAPNPWDLAFPIAEIALRFHQTDPAATVTSRCDRALRSLDDILDHPALNIALPTPDSSEDAVTTVTVITSTGGLQHHHFLD